MAWDLATGQVKVGAQGAVWDTQITALMNTALALAEKYCDRHFLFKEEIVKFYDQTVASFQLPRWPIETVFGITPNSASSRVEHVHKTAGVLELHGQQFVDLIEVHYSGGYKQLPEDLELALWDIFNTLWSTYGPNAGSGGGATVAIGAVKKKTITGVGSIEYETGGGSASGGSGSGSIGDFTSVMPGATLAILQLYRRVSA